MEEFRDFPVSNTKSGVEHIYEDIASNFLEHAEQVGLNKSKKCLDGT